MSRPGMISETLPCGESSQRVARAASLECELEANPEAELGLNIGADFEELREWEECDGWEEG